MADSGDARARLALERADSRQLQLQAELAASRRAASAAAHENERLSREVLLLREARDAAQTEARESEAFAKKLEVKLLAGKGTYLVEQNVRQRASLADLQREHEVRAGGGGRGGGGPR